MTPGLVDRRSRSRWPGPRRCHLDLHDAGQHLRRDPGDAARRALDRCGPVRRRGWRRRRSRRRCPGRRAGSPRRRRRRRRPARRGRQRRPAGPVRAARGRSAAVAESVGGGPGVVRRCPRRPPWSSAARRGAVAGWGAAPSAPARPTSAGRCRTTTGRRRRRRRRRRRVVRACSSVMLSVALVVAAGRPCVLPGPLPSAERVEPGGDPVQPAAETAEGAAVRGRWCGSAATTSSTVRSGASATTV